MRINCSTQKNERATAYPHIIINETTNKTEFVDAYLQGSRKGMWEEYLLYVRCVHLQDKGTLPTYTCKISAYTCKIRALQDNVHLQDKIRADKDKGT